MMSLRKWSLALSFLLSLPNLAWAATPQKTTAAFADWTVVCEQSDTKQKNCEVLQVQTLPGQNGPASQISIGSPTKDNVLKVTFQIPPNVWLVTGVKLSIEGKDLAPGKVIWCAPARCLAEAEVKLDEMSKLRSSGSVQLTFKDPTRRDVTIPVSLKGFGDAFDQLLKQ